MTPQQKRVLEAPCEIPLRNRTGDVRAYTRLDAVDYARFGQNRWHLVHGYAGRSFSAKGNRRTIWLHREIMGLASDDARFVDHINRDGLDNRRSNLRIVTHAQNHQNRALDPRNKSGYRGVSWSQRCGKWYARAELPRNHNQ